MGKHCYNTINLNDLFFHGYLKVGDYLCLHVDRDVENKRCKIKVYGFIDHQIRIVAKDTKGKFKIFEGPTTWMNEFGFKKISAWEYISLVRTKERLSKIRRELHKSIQDEIKAEMELFEKREMESKDPDFMKKKFPLYDR